MYVCVRSGLGWYSKPLRYQPTVNVAQQSFLLNDCGELPASDACGEQQLNTTIDGRGM